MWADDVTKQMQGRAFREMRVKLMNFAVNDAEDMIDNVTVGFEKS